MRYIVAKKNDSICIGRQGENNAVTVQFDVSGWKEMYGNGSFSLLHQRSNDVMAYPCAITSDANTVSWVITSTDVHDVGTGKVQLLYIVNDIVAKSVVYTTVTTQSLNAGDVPDPEPEWITDVLNAGLDAEAYAVGERNGNPVEEGDPAYHNNAKWFAENVADSIFWVNPHAPSPTTVEELTNALDSGKYPIIKTGENPERYLEYSGHTLQYYIDSSTAYEIDVYNFEYITTGGIVYKCALRYNRFTRLQTWDSVTSTEVFAQIKSIANGYLATSTYSVGDYVYFSGRIYRCKTDIVTPESFNSTHWQLVPLADDVEALNNSVVDINNAISNIKGIFWVTRGTTTQQEIASAISAGKLPVIKYTYNQSGYQDIIYLPLAYEDYQYNYTYWSYVFSCTRPNGDSYSISLSSYDYGRTWAWGSLVTSYVAKYAYSSGQRYVLGGTNTTNETITFDSAPTANSTKLLTSGAVHSALNARNPLIVTCTPTALDYSGTMDKTVAEMYEAYQAGRRIVAKVVTGNGEYIEAEITMRFSDGSLEYPSFNAFIIDDGNDQLIEMATGATEDGTRDTYLTAIYNLVSKDPIGYSSTSDPYAVLDPCPTTYSFGELGELTISGLNGGDGYEQYHFSFSCPSSAPTVLSIPSEIGLSGDTTLEAGGYYEVDIWNRIAIIKKIEVAS